MKYEVTNVEKSELLEELLAMVKTCFEGEAILVEDKIHMRLPGGEAFVLGVETAV